MSTKRLSKTAIEGGRTRYNKWDRGYSSREMRSKEREYLTRAKGDDEYSDTRIIDKRRKVYKDFDDKLGPMYRWLRKHIGQRWDAVKSKAVSTYDSRTTAGRHILYDHLFQSVSEVPDPANTWRRFDFYVDDDGLLQLGERNRWNRWGRNRKEDPGYVRLAHDELYRWAANRKVIDYGEVQFWTRLPTRWGMSRCHHDARLGRCPYGAHWVAVKTLLYYKTLDEVPSWRRRGAFEENGRIYERDHQWHCHQPLDHSLAQGNKFTKDEAAFWATLHPYQKAMLVQPAKDNKRKR